MQKQAVTANKTKGNSMNNKFDLLGHFYVPIAYFYGAVLKYESVVTAQNHQHLIDKHPDGILLDAYKGDRINTNDHSAYAG